MEKVKYAFLKYEPKGPDAWPIGGTFWWRMRFRLRTLLRRLGVAAWIMLVLAVGAGDASQWSLLEQAQATEAGHRIEALVQCDFNAAYIEGVQTGYSNDGLLVSVVVLEAQWPSQACEIDRQYRLTLERVR